LYSTRDNTPTIAHLRLPCHNIIFCSARYGGGETFRQYWPIEQGSRPEAPLITGDSFQFPDTGYGGITEYYWLVSTGVAVVVDENMPLFFSKPCFHN